MATFLTGWAVLAVVVAVVVGRMVRQRDRQIPRPAGDGPPACPGCGCALCPDCESEGA